MLKNYFLLAVRNLLKHKLYSIINILGLAVGLACCLLIVLYINNELRYDRHHAKAERIYRVLEDIALNGVTENSASVPFPVATRMQAEFPDIEAITRFFRPQTALSLRYEDKLFREDHFYYADSSVFEVFSFRLLAGNAATALNKPFTVVLTRETARRYFGNADPMGKVLQVDAGQGNTISFTVTGIVADQPATTHFRFDALASFASLLNFMGPQTLEHQWWWNPCWTYLVLPEKYPPEKLEALLPGFVEKYFPPSIGRGIRLSLQALADIHLHSRRDLEISANSDVSYIYIFAAVAFMVLLIACINFMNLATARSAGRAREVGMRKVMGARRGQLIRQFLGESLLISFLAVILGAVLCELCLPFFNDFAGKQLSVHWFSDWRVAPALLLLGITVGLLAGSYPAFFLSVFQPVKVLKGKQNVDSRSTGLRKALVIGQFAASIALLIGAAIILDQLAYIQEKNLGFNKDHTVVIKTVPPMFGRVKAVKKALEQHPGIRIVTGMSERIGAGVQIRQYFPEGAGSDNPSALAGLGVDIDFLNAMDIEVVQGRGFSRSHPTDTTRAYLLNETAVQQLGWEQPIGKRFSMWMGDDFLREGEIVGVVRDFNYASLHQPVESLVLFVWPFLSELAIKIEPHSTREALAHIEAVWKKFCPGEAFHYAFLDEGIRQLYAAEEKLANLILYFACFAVFVACLGLFGLASFTVEQRVREIGIRKTLGASAFSIVVLLAGEFSKLVLLSALVAAPLAWYLLNSWLQDFAFRVGIGWQPFVFATFTTLAIALVTVSLKTVRAALSNPVKSIG